MSSVTTSRDTIWCMVTPKKSLGQHWLYDEATLDAICDSAHVTSGDTVLEVGPGLGTLTRKLLERGAAVTAVEFDHDLAISLTQNLLEGRPIGSDVLQQLTVVESDILRFNFGQMPDGYKVVANIPYYLTSNLIRVITESHRHFSIASILIQKEVAERVAAKPGHMSILAVTAQFYCDVSLGVFVPAKLFTPPPKVDSQVLVLNYRETLLFPGIDAKAFFHLVKAGFSQKRKTLQNSLSGGLSIDKAQAAALLERAGVKPTSRAQELSLEDWHRLYLHYA